MGLPRFPCTAEQMAKALNDIDKSINKAPVRAQLAEDMTANGTFSITNVRATQPGQATPSITTAVNVWNLAGHNLDEVLLIWDETANAYVFQNVAMVSLALMTTAADNGTTAVTGTRQTTRVMTSGNTSDFNIFTTNDCV